MRAWLKKLQLAALRRHWPTGDQCGYVSWCRTVPLGRTWAVHRFSILEAVEVAAAFVYAKCGSCNPLETRIVAGSELLESLISLPFFVPQRSEGEDGTCMGYLNSRKIIFDRTLPKHEGYLTYHNEWDKRDFCTLISIVD